MLQGHKMERRLNTGRTAKITRAWWYPCEGHAPLKAQPHLPLEKGERKQMTIGSVPSPCWVLDMMLFLTESSRKLQRVFKMVTSMGLGIRQPWVQCQICSLLVERRRSYITPGILRWLEVKVQAAPQGGEPRALREGGSLAHPSYVSAIIKTCISAQTMLPRQTDRTGLLARGPAPPAGSKHCARSKSDQGFLPWPWGFVLTHSHPQPQGGHSRHSFSSLLSKQSGSPSHCHAPGMQRPLLHMKLPGMLHSLVTLFPGSSWLSVGKRGQGGQKAQEQQPRLSPHQLERHR
jgi:hypothetical protein